MGAARVAAVVLAGGSGTRLGAGQNKAYLSLRGRPMVGWSLALMRTLPALCRLVLVIRPEDRELARAVDAFVELVDGGPCRHESEYNALRALRPAIAAGHIDVVVMHDAARPLATPALLREVVDVAARHGGAVPGLPAPGLVRLDADGVVAGRLDGVHLRVQTPQAFAARALLAAYDAAARDGYTGTDTSASIERYGGADVRAVAGSAENVKVTVAEDLARAQRLLAQRR